jgi:hypothetical protein
MLSANDRDEVVRWSQRQLGSRAGTVFITENFCTEAESVEKDGTGIRQAKAVGCLPVFGNRAHSSQDVDAEHGCFECLDARVRNFHKEIGETTWH